MSKVYQRPAARRDLISHYVYLADNAGADIAERFLDHAEESFFLLADQPHLGAALTLRSKELDGLRKWHVKEFEKFLIFYLPRKNGISVLRVLHAAQDWWGLFEVDEKQKSS